MKLLKIEGVKEIIVSGCDIRCPLNCLNVKCKICASIDVENHHYGEFPADCPLPEYVSENEHTAPDGTELVAEQATETYSYFNCLICHYYKEFSNGEESVLKCTRDSVCPDCVSVNRRDGRNIAWVKKSEVK